MERMFLIKPTVGQSTLQQTDFAELNAFLADDEVEDKYIAASTIAPDLTWAVIMVTDDFDALEVRQRTYSE